MNLIFMIAMIIINLLLKYFIIGSNFGWIFKFSKVRDQFATPCTRISLLAKYYFG